MIIQALRKQELIFQGNYLTAQLLNGWRNPFYQQNNVLLETQLMAVNEELKSLNKINYKA